MVSKVLSAAAVAFALAGSASASTVEVKYQPSGVFGPDNLQQSVRIHSPSYNGKPPVGMYHLNGDGGMGDFLAFCVDLAQYLGSPTTYSIKPDLLSGTVLENVDKLFNSVLGGGTLGEVIDTSIEAAGMQLALWELITETDDEFSIDSGDFFATENVAAQDQAQSYLDGLADATTGGYNITFLYSATKQDVVTVAPVPLPAAGLLMVFGLGGLAAVGRRRKVS